MAKITFQTLSFQEKGNDVQIPLLKHFSTAIPKEELNNIGEFVIKDPHTIEFKSINEDKAKTRFLFLFDKYLKNLKTKLTGNKAIYIHQNSEIPLIGNASFGIVYRNSSIIEIKPVTSCNLNCIYCSVGEGLSSKKNDFVIEKDYLVEELEKLIDFINENTKKSGRQFGGVEVHIGVQGEPFFYAPIEELIADLQKNKNIHTISIDTNATLLNKEKIDQLAKYNKLQLNFSLDAMDEKLAQKLCGTKTYNLKHVLEMIKYASERVKVIVAPVLVPGYNEQEMKKIILFIKSLKKQPKLGIQNFLRYKTGRNPTKAWEWKKFYQFIEDLEKKHNIKLKWDEEDFGIKKTKPLPKPFKIGDEVKAVIKCPDRFPDSCIAVAEERMISIPNCKYKKDKQIKVKIVKDKHNIFSGRLITW